MGNSRFLCTEKQGVIFQNKHILEYTNLSQSNDIVREILNHNKAKFDS